MSTLTLSDSNPTFSPLEPIFAPHADQIPFAFREQFLHSPDDDYGITLDGKMHTIWYKPRALSPLFWLLGKIGILVPRMGKDIPTTLVVKPGRDSAGKPFHLWARTLQFDPPIIFNTTIIYDGRLGEVVDLVGPGNALYMVWQARFHPPDRFTLDTEAFAFQFGQGRLLWIPRPIWPWLLGVVRFVQRVDAQHNDTVHIDLVITHPVFGEIFGYTGTFKVVRTPR